MVVAAVAAAALSGCGGEPSPPADRAAFPHCGLGHLHGEHACFHAERGPFATVEAAAAPAPPAALEREHTVYRVTLPAAGSGRLSFTPRQGGLWAFLVDREVELRLRGMDGRPRALLLRERRTGCAAFLTAFVFRLGDLEPVVLELSARGGAQAGPVSLLPERLGNDWDVALQAEPCEAPVRDGGADAGPDVLSPGRDAGGDAPDREADAGAPDAEGGAPPADAAARDGAAPMCRTSGPCLTDDECCEFCHDQDHCH